jgi:nucleotide-binding universal stress UspA family protein
MGIMAIKTILTAVSGGGATEGAIEMAFALARRFGAHVEGLHVKVDDSQTVMLLGDGMTAAMSSGLIDRIAADAEATARAAKANFVGALTHHRLMEAATPAAAANQPSATWRVESGYAPDVVANRARLFDLVVLGRSDRVLDEPHSDTIEDVVLQSGRPVLLAPAKATTEFGKTIAIGWNGTPEAVHAVVAALPFLEAARAVRVVSVGTDEAEDGSELVDYLAWHGIAATVVSVHPVKGVGAGELLLATARDEGADLLVMGGWGHAPLRELLFGGATRQLVETSLMPLLLAH